MFKYSLICGKINRDVLYGRFSNYLRRGSSKNLSCRLFRTVLLSAVAILMLSMLLSACNNAAPLGNTDTTDDEPSQTAVSEDTAASETISGTATEAVSETAPAQTSAEEQTTDEPTDAPTEEMTEPFAFTQPIDPYRENNPTMVIIAADEDINAIYNLSCGLITYLYSTSPGWNLDDVMPTFQNDADKYWSVMRLAMHKLAQYRTNMLYTETDHERISITDTEMEDYTAALFYGMDYVPATPHYSNPTAEQYGIKWDGVNGGYTMQGMDYSYLSFKGEVQGGVINPTLTITCMNRESDINYTYTIFLEDSGLDNSCRYRITRITGVADTYEMPYVYGVVNYVKTYIDDVLGDYEYFTMSLDDSQYENLIKKIGAVDWIDEAPASLEEAKRINEDYIAWANRPEGATSTDIHIYSKHDYLNLADYVGKNIIIYGNFLSAHTKYHMRHIICGVDSIYEFTDTYGY